MSTITPQHDLAIVPWEPLPQTEEQERETEDVNSNEFVITDGIQQDRATAAYAVLMDIRKAVEHGYDWSQLIQLPHTIISSETTRSIIFHRAQQWLKDSYPFLCAIAYGVATEHHATMLQHVVLDSVHTFPEHIFADILNALGNEHPEQHG